MTYIYLLPALFLASAMCHAANYSCSTEFGETVLLRKVVLKRGVSCKACESIDYEIPKSHIEEDVSYPDNNYVKSIPGLKTRHKRRRFVGTDGQIVLVESRYARADSRGFEFQMSCGPGNDPEWPNTPKCQGRLIGGKDDRHITWGVGNFDRRTMTRSWVELMLGDNPHLGFITRVFEERTDGRSQERLSAVGEIKFFNEDTLFIQDVGVDQWETLLKDLKLRRAALEIKITCRKK